MSTTNTELKKNEGRLYRYWEAMYLAFYSKHVYVDAAKRWRGFGLFYLFLVMALFSLPYAIQMTFHYTQLLQDRVLYPLSQIPTIEVRDGKAFFDKPMPYLIHNGLGQVAIIIDSKGNLSELSAQYPDLVVLINSDSVMLKKFAFGISAADGSTENNFYVQSFSHSANTVFNGAELLKSKEVVRLKFISQWLAFTITLAFLFPMVAVILLVLAGLGKISAIAFFSFYPPYMASCRLMMVAATPMLLLFFLALTFGVWGTYFSIVLIGLLSLYYNFGIVCFKRDSQQMVRS